MNYLAHWSDKSGLSKLQLWRGLGLPSSKLYAWQQRQDQPAKRNAPAPRGHWTSPEERAAIIAFAKRWPLEGYRRLTYMMMDADIACVTPSTTYRVLKAAGLMGRKPIANSKKGKGFDQPTTAHQHWHIDVTHLNLGGSYYYLFAVIDGYSRAIVHWEIAQTMKEPRIELGLQRAKERYPTARPRIISDNGPQFISHDFKAFIRLAGMTHVRTSPYYPQSNGKMERWFGTAKNECLRPAQPKTEAEANKLVSGYVAHYNEVRLHSSIGYVAPMSRLSGEDAAIQTQRKAKLAKARQIRLSSTQPPAPEINPSDNPNQASDSLVA
jgi:putative transposase